MSRLKTVYKHVGFTSEEPGIFRGRYADGESFGWVEISNANEWFFRGHYNRPLNAAECAEIAAFLRQLEEREK